MSLVMRARALRRGEHSSAHHSTGTAAPPPPAPDALPARPRLDPTAVLERAAFLEFCEGLLRSEADARALAEAGFPSWEALALRLAETNEIERTAAHG